MKIVRNALASARGRRDPDDDSLKILISAPYFGGIGGAERALSSWLLALEGHSVDVCARKVIPSEYSINAPHVRLLGRWRFIAPRRRYIHRLWQMARWLRLPRSYDLLIQFKNGADVTRYCRAKTKVLSPSGNATGSLEERVDYVISQAPGGIDLIQDARKHVVVVPPVFTMADTAQPVEGLPEEFYLTVFNPYSTGLKGTDLLLNHAKVSSKKIVWCHSVLSEDQARAILLCDNIMSIADPTQAQLLYLYQRCSAYVSFSRSEGFGWSIADALLLQKPIISRHIGVLTLYQAGNGLHIYDTEDELCTLLRDGVDGRAAYELDMLAPHAAARKITALARER